MSAERLPIEPSLLIWARTAIGLDIAKAAHRLSISVQILNRWESGDLHPTIKQLRKVADIYRIPLAVLLLHEPPIDFEPIRDYRKLIDGIAMPVSPELHAELRRADMQREVYLEISVLAPDTIIETDPPPTISLTLSAEDAGRRLREYLGISLETQRRWANPYEALNGWIDALESRGILVIHTTRVPIAEARGFSVSELPYPVIALNGSDWPRPRTFTLLHELAHIALNVGGLCDLHEARRTTTVDADRIETYCNAVAAAALVPSDDLLSLSQVATRSPAYEWTSEELNNLALRYKLSPEALLLRLISLHRASWELYWRRKEELETIYAEARADRKQRQKESETTGSYYRTKARDIGHSYAHAVFEAYRTKAISALDACDYLQVKFNQMPKLEGVLR